MRAFIRKEGLFLIFFYRGSGEKTFIQVFVGKQEGDRGVWTGRMDVRGGGRYVTGSALVSLPRRAVFMAFHGATCACGTLKKP